MTENGYADNPTGNLACVQKLSERTTQMNINDINGYLARTYGKIIAIKINNLDVATQIMKTQKKII